MIALYTIALAIAFIEYLLIQILTKRLLVNPELS